MTHWKSCFKSDYLASSDVEGGDLKLIIKNVKREECTLSGGKKLCNVAYFTDTKFKPMILNVENSTLVKKFSGGKTQIEEWNNIAVSIYVNPNVRFGTETVEGLRIRPVQPSMEKPKLTPDMNKWVDAIKHLKGGGKITDITKGWSMTKDDIKKLEDAAKPEA